MPAQKTQNKEHNVAGFFTPRKRRTGTVSLPCPGPLETAVRQLNAELAQAGRDIFLAVDLRHACQQGTVEISRRGHLTLKIPVRIRDRASVQVADHPEVFAAREVAVPLIVNALRIEIEAAIGKESADASV